MSRTVSEWIGKTDDTPIPPRVRLRAAIRAGDAEAADKALDRYEPWADYVFADRAPPTLAEALALPEVRALVEAAILDAQLRAFEQRRLDTPDEIKTAANARIAAAQEGEG